MMELCDCGHEMSDHSMLSQGATYGQLGQLCQNAGCLCTWYTVTD